MLKYMLDTNIAIYTIKNRPAEVREAFRAHDGLVVVTNNLKQFDNAPGIRLANWVG